MKISVLIAFGIVLILDFVLFSVLLKKAKNTAKNEIRFPISVSGLIFVLYSAVLVLLGYHAACSDYWSVSAGICFAAFFALILIFFFFAAFNSEIIFDENGFSSRDFFGRKQYFLYSDVTFFTNKNDEYLIRCGKNSVSYFSNSEAAKEFYKIVKEKYSEYAEKTVPEKPEDIFRGNLKNPVEQGLGMAILFVFGIALFAAAVFMPSLLSPPDESELFKKELAFQSFEEHKHRSSLFLYLYSDGEEYAFKTQAHRFISGFESIPEKCDGKTIFTVLYKPDIFNSNAYEIFGLSDESGFVYYSPEVLDRTEDLVPLRLICVCAGILLIGPAIFMFYAARNPQKFSRKFLEFIFKDEIIVDK